MAWRVSRSSSDPGAADEATVEISSTLGAAALLRDDELRRLRVLRPDDVPEVAVVFVLALLDALLERLLAPPRRLRVGRPDADDAALGGDSCSGIDSSFGAARSVTLPRRLLVGRPEADDAVLGGDSCSGTDSSVVAAFLRRKNRNVTRLFYTSGSELENAAPRRDLLCYLHKGFSLWRIRR